MRNRKYPAPVRMPQGARVTASRDLGSYSLSTIGTPPAIGVHALSTNDPAGRISALTC